MRSIPTAPIAGSVFIAGYAVVVASGSRPLGGVVLAVGGLWCIRSWLRRLGPRTATELACVCLGGFVASHLLALAIGPWPSVLAVAAVASAIVWVRADARASEPARAITLARYDS
jgi:hypothetical protein